MKAWFEKLFTLTPTKRIWISYFLGGFLISVIGPMGELYLNDYDNFGWLALLCIAILTLLLNSINVSRFEKETFWMTIKTGGPKKDTATRPMRPPPPMRPPAPPNRKYK